MLIRCCSLLSNKHKKTRLKSCLFNPSRFNSSEGFRGGLVFKAHRRLYHPPLGLRVIKKKRKKCGVEVFSTGQRAGATRVVRGAREREPIMVLVMARVRHSGESSFINSVTYCEGWWLRDRSEGLPGRIHQQEVARCVDSIVICRFACVGQHR